MIDIGGALVEESFTEYAVSSSVIGGQAVIECDSRAEANDLAGRWDGVVLVRHVYITEWQEED